MAVDPSDLLDPPYSFGECSVAEALPAVTCECFKSSTFTYAVARKQGDWVNVNISNVFMEVKNEEIDFATIKIAPFLPSEFLGGDKARKRIFGCLVRAFELETEVLRVTPAMITMDKDGSMTINPVTKVVNRDDRVFETVATSNFFFTTPTTKGSIGTYNINFSFVANDEHSFDSDIKLTKIEEAER